MKKYLIILSSFFLLSFISFSSSDSSELKMNEFLKNLISKMTLEEKVGQMTQLAIQAVSVQPRDENGKLIIKEDKLREAIIKYHISSLIDAGGAVNSLEEWHKLLTLIQDISLKETRLGIPNIYGIDAIHGIHYTKGATVFPHAIAMAATRNINLIEKAGEITALEVRASGIPWNFNPVLGVGREPLWPRMYETFGEDTYLVTQFGKNYIKGLQGSNIGNSTKVAACMKHYLGYSIPNNGFDRTPAWIPERIIREIFLPPFAAAVQQGCQTVMVNSSEINGIPVHSNEFLINGILKNELGFKGFVVSDWEDIKRLHTRDKVAATPKEAVRMAVMAGLDMSMVPLDFSFYDLLIELVKEGSVPMSRIDDAVFRILRVKYMLGLFDNPYPNKDLLKDFATEKSTQINLQAARETITLLENKNSTLPLNKNIKVLVTGPNANLLSVLNGGWSLTWQGNNESLFPEEKFTILEAIQNKIGKEKVSYVQGTEFDKDINTQQAVKAAKNADAVILCLGEKTYAEFRGNITNLSLPNAQIELAKKLYATGKPVILVLIEGRPRIINQIADDAMAVVMAYLPGMEGGKAIADVLFGDVNPSGKLPFTYPRDVNGYTTYDHKPLDDFEEVTDFNPQWEFGRGLSYTSYKYDNLRLDNDKIKIGEPLNISVDVTNTGKRKGKEAVELFLSDLYGSVTRPVKQLKRFTKINLNPGETKTVRFTLTQDDLSFYGRDNNKIIEPGEFKISIENLSKNFMLK